MVLGLQACTSNSDESITKDIKAKIAADKTVATQSVEVASKEGVVTLSGTVDSAAQAQTIVNLAQSVTGVKRVDTKVTVKGTQPTVVPAPAIPTPGQAAPQSAPQTEPAPATQPAQ